jgi:hypothetical protein
MGAMFLALTSASSAMGAFGSLSCPSGKLSSRTRGWVRQPPSSKLARPLPHLGRFFFPILWHECNLPQAQ